MALHWPAMALHWRCNHELFPGADQNVEISTFHFFTLWKSADMRLIRCRIPAFSPIFTGFLGYFHKALFPMFSNPWHIRLYKWFGYFYHFFVIICLETNDSTQHTNEDTQQTATVRRSYPRGCWRNSYYCWIASTSIEINPENMCLLRVDLKHSKLKINCFNKNQKMLKQFRITNDIYNNWKNLGDKLTYFRGRVEAN